jgi:2-polyprenyl-3-methyl-5-hydroxy-6-metoxy-1,4-benzoquinol methylase
MAFGVAANAQAQLEARLAAAVKKIETACSDDLKKYCSTVTPGEGRLLLCMQAHEDKISTKCDYAVFDASRNLERALDRIEQVADICWNDIEKHCVDIPAGGGNITQCLAGKKASLTTACQTEVGKFQSGK